MAGVVVALALTLTGCTPAIEFGARLNVDGTVDFVTCNDWNVRYIEVDFEVRSNRDGEAEWIAEAPTDQETNGVVVHFGEPPPNFVTTELRPIPAEWDMIQFAFGNLQRDELTVGQWTWDTAQYAWIPDEPCLDESTLEGKG